MSDVLPLRISPSIADPPADSAGSPLVVDARRLAVMLCAGIRTVRTWDAAGKLPHYILPDGSIRLRWDEVEPLVRRMPGSLTSIEGVNRG
jgi:YD repeat-containing protein